MKLEEVLLKPAGDSKENWELNNPIIPLKMLAIEYNPLQPSIKPKLKVGIGFHWNDTPYFSAGGGEYLDYTQKLLGSNLNNSNQFTLTRLGTRYEIYIETGLQHDDDYTIVGSLVTFNENVSDEQRIRVMVYNQSTVAQEINAALPAPVGLRASSRTLTSITLVCNPVPNADSYSFEYSSDNGSSWISETSVDAEITLEGLTPDTFYMVRVRAVSDNPLVAPSSPSSPVLENTQPSGPPVILGTDVIAPNRVIAPYTIMR